MKISLCLVFLSLIFSQSKQVTAKEAKLIEIIQKVDKSIANKDLAVFTSLHFGETAEQKELIKVKFSLLAKLVEHKAFFEGDKKNDLSNGPKMTLFVLSMGFKEFLSEKDYSQTEVTFNSDTSEVKIQGKKKSTSTLDYTFVKRNGTWYFNSFAKKRKNVSYKSQGEIFSLYEELFDNIILLDAKKISEDDYTNVSNEVNKKMKIISKR